ncbi:MAG: hypothetical protein H0U16_06880 [Actinobacteria bacterium]|nr:hypothetical protein [Actinomycetota bacterium]
MHIEKSLSGLRNQLEGLLNERRIVEEQILFQMDVAEEAKTRMLIAETPLADRDYRIARDDLDRMHRERDDLSARIVAIRQDQDRLLDRMLG